MSSPEPRLPPPTLGLTGVADADNPLLWRFTVTDTQGARCTLNYGDGQSDQQNAAQTLNFVHTYELPGDYIVVAHSTAGGQADAALAIFVEEPVVEVPPEETYVPVDELLISPYELSHEIVVEPGIGQNPTADVVVTELLYPYARGRFAKAKVVTGDGPQARKRIAPVDPIIG